MKAPSECSDSAVLSLSQAAAMLGIHRSTAYDLAKRDRFPVPVLKVGSQLKVSKAAMECYLAGGGSKEGLTS